MPTAKTKTPPQEGLLLSEEIFVAYHDESGRKTVHHHIVWDRPRFMLTRALEALALNKAKGSTKARAEQITRAEYLKERR